MQFSPNANNLQGVHRIGEAERQVPAQLVRLEASLNELELQVRSLLARLEGVTSPPTMPDMFDRMAEEYHHAPKIDPSQYSLVAQRVTNSAERIDLLNAILIRVNEVLEV